MSKKFVLFTALMSVIMVQAQNTEREEQPRSCNQTSETVNKRCCSGGRPRCCSTISTLTAGLINATTISFGGTVLNQSVLDQLLALIPQSAAQSTFGSFFQDVSISTVLNTNNLVPFGTGSTVSSTGTPITVAPSGTGSRFTLPAAGNYEISWDLGINPTVVGGAAVGIFLNNSASPLAGTQVGTNAAGVTQLSGTSVIAVGAAGDTIDLRNTGTNAITLNPAALGASGTNTQFVIRRIS